MDLFCKKVVGNGNKFGRICVVADQLSGLRSRTPRCEPAPSSLSAKRKSVFRASLLQSPARDSDAREAMSPELVEGPP
jgi:hypothetical protein